MGIPFKKIEDGVISPIPSLLYTYQVLTSKNKTPLFDSLNLLQVPTRTVYYINESHATFSIISERDK